MNMQQTCPKCREETRVENETTMFGLAEKQVLHYKCNCTHLDVSIDLSMCFTHEDDLIGAVLTNMRREKEAFYMATGNDPEVAKIIEEFVKEKQ